MVSLERIAASREAVFAIDTQDRIIVWNRACETVFGHSSRAVLGKPCWEILGGRDVHGNCYCYEHCPVVYQLREVDDQPLRSFRMSARCASGASKMLSVSAFALDASHRHLRVIVHVVRELPGETGPLERRLHALSKATGTVSERAPRIDGLTKREREVLCCLASGVSTSEIASMLGIKTVTVRNHVRNILQKLGVHTRFAAVAYAYQHGLV